VNLLEQKQRAIEAHHKRFFETYRTIAEKLLVKPSLLLKAKQQLREKIAKSPPSLPYLLEWEKILNTQSAAQISKFLSTENEENIALFSCAPFAGHEFR